MCYRRSSRRREPEPAGSAKLRVGAMARILGISRQHLSNLARRRRLPYETVDGVRAFDVDRVLVALRHSGLRLPLMRAERSPRDDLLWAVQALSRGPWNLPTAASCMAWFWYLEAKRDSVIRRQLTSTVLKLRGY